MIEISKPAKDEYPAFYENYYTNIQFQNVDELYKTSILEFHETLSNLNESKWSLRYAKDKWSIRQVVSHVTDAERIMSYRALCFARGEKNGLPGFEENDYAAMSEADGRTPENLLEELKTVRAASIALFNSFDEEQFLRKGIANNNPASVRAVAWVIPAHMMHHLRIIKERYLSAQA